MYHSIKNIYTYKYSGITILMVNALVISTIKAALAMYCTYLYSKFISRNTWISIIMAFLFVMSPLYYRFTVYWPFFSDVFIWMPLLLFSIERTLQNKSLVYL